MAETTYALLQGNEACVEGGIAAGMRFFSGYPITPSTEIAEGSATRLPQVGGKFIQMEDEIGGIAAAIGASVAGVKSMTATSGPGFSLKQENLGYAALAEIPLVVVDVQRSGPSTGLPTSPSQGDVMQARWGCHGDHPVIAIAPASVQDTYDQTIRAFNLAEKYRTPVILLMDEIVGHMREGICLHPAAEIIHRDNRMVDGKPYAVAPGETVPHCPPFGTGTRYNITGLLHDDDGFPTGSSDLSFMLCSRLMKKVEENLDDILEYEEDIPEGTEIAILCYGGTTRAVEEAVAQARAQGIPAGMFRPVTVWPFPEEAFKALSKKVRHIVVAEHNYGQILLEAQRIAGGNCTLSHIGKVDGTTITPSEIVRHLKEVM
ncbi:2-oxoacid:acceptor oxidoreductase subunit alpha [Enterocloster lavalensis]|uniref:2-oxoacid:acceptor oxidoreductase subunit alpha n=1 Tax=Enterocloster lavalensis TaxID=460384 RepID=UPI001D079D10|nr:2-oxoacid:acceptor oxidoreductase subunit alpha [Enterocloster lavalensis]MCB6341388.1 2-oxoacid:acceptor oxidoreductase subunit alpha [Enterocloster lavalensis]